MPSTTETRRLECPVDEAFAFVADMTHGPEWDPGIVAARQTTPGPVGVDTTFELQLRFAGRELPMTYRVVSHDPPHRLVLEGTNATTTAVDHIYFAPEAGDARATRITWRLDLVFHGPATLMGPFAGPTVRRLGRHALDGLVRHLATHRPSR